MLTFSDFLERLTNKHLDLTGRNRLVNIGHAPGRTLRFLNPDLVTISKQIFEDFEAKLDIQSVPEPEKKLWETVNERLQRPDVKKYAASIGIATNFDAEIPSAEGSNEFLQSLYYPDELESRCRKLEKEGKSAYEEKGLKIVYLVMGFLEYPDQVNSDKIFNAPLVSIPINLIKSVVDKKTGAMKYAIQHNGDELNDNLSLREKLKRDFNFNLPEFLNLEGGFEDFESELDRYFAELEVLIEDKPNWKLKYEASIALLSFAKQVFIDETKEGSWQQGVDIKGFAGHEGIKAIYEGISSGNPNADYDSLDEYDIDKHPQENLPLIYDADSSQHSAIIDVLEGKSIVIEGPPGTGKSQTITNLIAALISSGKKVLFISDKLAALKVVKKRIENVGLGDFCLEIHSSRARTKDLLDEIQKRVELKINLSKRDLAEKASLFQSKKETLKTYKELINTVQFNKLDLKVNQVIWKTVLYRNRLGNHLNALKVRQITNAENYSPGDFSVLMDKFNSLMDAKKSIGAVGKNNPFWGFEPKSLSHHEVEVIEKIFQDLIQRAKEAQVVFSALDEKFISKGEGEFVFEDLCSLQNTLEVVETVKLGVDKAIFKFIWNKDLEGFINYQEEIFTLETEIVGAGLLKKQYESILNKAVFSCEDFKELLEVYKKFTYNNSLQLSGIEDLNRNQLKLASNIDAFVSALEVLNEFLGERNIPEASKVGDLYFLRELAEFCLSIPVDSINYVGGLDVDSKNEPELKLFLVKQANCNSLFNSLNTQLHLDAIPPEDQLKEAIGVFRGGSKLFGIFNAQYRAANKLFKSLSKVAGHSFTKKANLTREVLEFKRLNDDLNQFELVKQLLGSKFDGRLSNLQPYIDVIELNKKLQSYDGGSNRLNSLVNSLSIAVLISVAKNNDKFDRTFQMHQMLFKGQEYGLSESHVLAKIESFSEVSAQIDSLLAFHETLAGMSETLLAWSSSQASKIGDALSAAEALIEYEAKTLELKNNAHFQDVFGIFYDALDTDISSMYSAAKLLSTLKSEPYDFQSTIAYDFINEDGSLLDLVTKVDAVYDRMDNLIDELIKFGSFDPEAWSIPNNKFFVNFIDRTELALSDIEKLIPWSVYQYYKNELSSQGFDDFLSWADEGLIAHESLGDLFAWCFYSTIANKIYENNPLLKNFSGINHARIRSEFCELDKEIISLHGKKIALECIDRAQVPAGRSNAVVSERTDWALLKYLLPQSRPRVPIRRVMSQAFDAIIELKPCLMMSPIAVAQYLPKVMGAFDLVIMDEASQIRIEESFGSIARAKKMVVVGDPKQLPPTDFFDTSSISDGTQVTTTDAESILDACIGNFSSTRKLKWHYRSSHESLISFSNHHFYKNELIIFPSPFAKDEGLGVRTYYIEDAVYEANINHKEAIAIVNAAISHIMTNPNKSLGIVSLNLKQKDLIEESFYKQSKDNSAVSSYIAKWEEANEDFFVKNLENVQGDERDCIFVSTTFGKGPGMSKPRQNFGPISRENGWRRLNVLFTRARKSISLFTSMEPSDIIDDVSTPRGTKMLRAYLEFAKNGILETYEDTGGSYESEFEEAVGQMLINAGYEIKCQLGVSKFRIDIAVKSPDAEGSYLAAIECDGASYHSDRSARDRDRIRQEILENLGWKGRIWRIWSTDWYRSPDIEFAKLLSFLESLKKLPVVKSTPAFSPDAISKPLSVSPVQEALFEFVGEPEKTESVFVDYSEVEEGDAVTFYSSKDGGEKTVKIVNGPSVLDQGIVSSTTPLAQALLGAVEGEKVILRIMGSENQELLIKRIIKPG